MPAVMFPHRCLLGSFKRRKRKSIIVTMMLLIVSVLILIFGLAATTRTQNITVGGYYPGVIVSTCSRSTAGLFRVHMKLGMSEGSVCSKLFPLLDSDENNYWRSLMGEFSPHSLFSIAVIMGWVRQSVSAHKCVFFTVLGFQHSWLPATFSQMFLLIWISILSDSCFKSWNYKEDMNIEFKDKTERNFELTNSQICVNKSTTFNTQCIPLHYVWILYSQICILTAIFLVFSWALAHFWDLSVLI